MLGPCASCRAAAAAPTTGSAPTSGSGRDELVDHDLRAVGEVAELRFPDYERLRLPNVVAVLEADVAISVGASCVPRRRRAPRDRLPSALNFSPVSASCSTAWRWLKVPRSASCPVMRIGTPSASNEAKASASAAAQSTARSSGCADFCARFSRRAPVSCAREPVGQLQQLLVQSAAPRAAPPSSARGGAGGRGLGGIGSTSRAPARAPRAPLQLVQVLAVHRVGRAW